MAYDLAAEASRLLREACTYSTNVDDTFGADTDDVGAEALLQALEALVAAAGEGLLDQAVQEVVDNGNFATRIAAVQARLTAIAALA